MTERLCAPPIPLALYVHIPWCLRKCPYCDFNSHRARGPLEERCYVDALLRDLEQDARNLDGRAIESIFIGGGTPSLFSAEAIGRLLSGVKRELSLSPSLEVTLEANPGTLERHKFRDYRMAGVNRLSIGVQSFDPQLLQRLGRVHDRSEALHAAEEGHRAGFENINLDLMYGLPAQSVSQALSDLDTAIDLGPSHISHYQLTLEPNTVFHRYPPELPDDDTAWQMQERCQTRLAQRGYVQYEVSAYARQGRRCRHNLNYWEFGDYLGIGAGAHGKLTDSANCRITRLWKLKHPRDYLTHAGTPEAIGGHKRVSDDALGLEFAMNALRLVDGVPARLFSERTRRSLERWTPILSAARNMGLLIEDPNWIQTTGRGRRFLDDLLQMFIPVDTHDG